MCKKKYKWIALGRKLIVLLLFCGLLLPMLPKAQAASITYVYNWIKDKSGLPTDNEWHDYFIAWEDLDDANKVWFTNYHWYTADGYNNYDAGGSDWMEYKAASTLPDNKSESFTSLDKLGHMQIKYAGIDRDNGNAPKYYIRVSKMNGGYAYFDSFEPTNDASEAQAFTFEDHGDVFHIYANITGIDRYLTRNDEYLETTYATSYGGGEKYRPLRIYQRDFIVNETEEETIDGEVIGKVTLYEYEWVNTLEELQALSKSASDWQDILLAWNDAQTAQTSDPDSIWYTKEAWFEGDSPNYKSNAHDGRFGYWSNDQLGSGYTSAATERFVLPERLGHFQVKADGSDKSNEIVGVTDANGKGIEAPQFKIRFTAGTDRYIYLGDEDYEEKEKDAAKYTMQMFLEEDKKDTAGYYYGYTHVFVNIAMGEDEYLSRKGNCMRLQEHNYSDDWQYYFRIYAGHAVEYDAIVKSFTIGKGATYSIDKNLILKKDVTITVEDGGVLMVDRQLLNNGQIIVKKGGTVIVNEGAYIMAFSEKDDGKITLEGGNLVIMDDAKVICDMGDGKLLASNGATISNRGVLMVSDVLELRNNSCLKNETTGMLMLGKRVALERGAVGAMTTHHLLDCTKNTNFAFLCSTKSKLYNYGTIVVPQNSALGWDPQNGNIVDMGQIMINR